MNSIVELGETAIMVIMWAIIISIYGIIFGLILKGLDRKVAARMQYRVGPPLRQPFIDVKKLLFKENIVPKDAVEWVFNGAPVVALASSILVLMYIPFSGESSLLNKYGDLVLILYLLIIPALSMVIGGFASGSPYATVGAQREMVAMMSYEFPLAVIVIAIGWVLSNDGISAAFALSTIINNPVWGHVGIIGAGGLLILLFSLIVVTPGELSKIPFDAPEAETELGGGILVEYSGRNLAMFYLADGVKTVVLSSLAVAIFFPYGISNILSLTGYAGTVADGVFFIIKVLIFVFMSVSMVRVAFARLKVDQISSFYWLKMGFISLVGLSLILIDGGF